MPRKRNDDSDLGGDYARDAHRGGYGDNYARDDERPASEGARATQSEGKKKVAERAIGKASE